MAGHLGAERVTTQNLKVVSVDAERGLILVQGRRPGCDGGYRAGRGCREAHGAEGSAVPGGACAKAAAEAAEPRKSRRREEGIGR